MIGLKKLRVSFATTLLATMALTPWSAEANTVDSLADLANGQTGSEGISNFREIPATWPSFLKPDKDGLDCWTMNISNCKFDNSVRGHGFIVAPMCREALQNFCVEELYAIDSTGKKYIAEPTRGINASNNRPFLAKTKSGTLRSGNPSLWRFPAGFADQREYLTNAFTMVTWEAGESHVSLVGLELAVTPIAPSTDPTRVIEQNLPDNFRFGVKLRLQWQIGGFLMGRIGSAAITQKTLEAGRSRIVTIEGYPEVVPKISGRSAGQIAYSMEGFDVFSRQAALLGDTATNIDRVFRAYARKTIDYSCAGFDSGFYGTGSTNAAIYAVDPPSLRNGSLNYEVASVHYLPDGKTLNLGRYEMSLRSDVARCIYGLSRAPISASINVLNQKGIKTLATSVVSEKNGWLKLQASGFTFSKKLISVKLVNKKLKKK